MSPASATVSQPPWQLDKKVPIALILAILVQTAGGVWYAAKQDARVEVLETQTKNLMQTVAKTTDAIVGVREAMAGSKATLDSIQQKLDRIERGIDSKR